MECARPHPAVEFGEGMRDAADNCSLVWAAPGKPVSVTLSPDLIARLAAAVSEGLQVFPSRGQEVGGLLLGKAKRTGKTAVVEVAGFEPLECEHAAGPSFLLSGPDRKLLEQRLRRFKSTEGLSIVGVYRTHTRKAPGLTLEDVDLMSAYFARPSNLFLLIRGHADGPPTAGFVIWEEGQIRSLTPYAEFVLRPVATAVRPDPEPHTTAAAVSAPSRADALPLTKAAAHRRPPWKRWQLAGLGAAGIAAGVVLAGLSRGPEGTVAAAREAPPATAAKSILPPPLEPASHPVPVAPVSAAVASNPSVPAAAPPDVVKESKGSSDRSVAEQPAMPVARRPLRVPAVSLSAEVPKLAPMPEPPLIAAHLGASEAGAPIGNGILNVPAPKAPDTFVRVTLDSSMSTRRSGFFSKFRLTSKGEKGPEFVPPKVVRQAETRVSPELRRRIKTEVPIDVKLFVDRAGKVEYAELLSDGRRLDRELVSLAVFTSRRWQFAPAQSGDEKVPAEVVLHFRFGSETP